MEARRIKELADEVVRATAGMPSAGPIRELMAEYVCQKSQEKRIVILLDVYSCLVQDFGGAGRSSATLEEGAQLDTFSTGPRLQDGPQSPGLAHPFRLVQQDFACSFCELIHEFYPRGRADVQRQTMIADHLEREHGVRLNQQRIAR